MNNIPPEEISNRAHEILRRILAEIGPRPAGSRAEKQAQEMIGRILAEKGLRLMWFDVPFSPSTRIEFYNFLAGVGLAAAACGLARGSFWLSLLMPFVIAVLPEMVWLARRSAPPGGGKSANLLALPADAQPEALDLILIAHMDSAPARPYGIKLWYQWREQAHKTTLRLALILAVLGIMDLVGFTLPPAILIAAQIVACLLAAVFLVHDLWEGIGGRGKFAPGANDNGSGAAVTAALAEALAAQPPHSARVGYLFSGAEETGLYGARQFAEYLAGKHYQGMVISVDMVGAGWKLKAVSGAGKTFRLKTDAEVLELLERADPSIERLHYYRRSGDFEPFCRAGIRAAGIEAEGTRRSWRAYHTEKDGMGVIDPEMLTHTVTALKQLVWLMDKGKAPLPGRGENAE
jgi:hypothetical protein